MTNEELKKIIEADGVCPPLTDDELVSIKKHYRKMFADTIKHEPLGYPDGAIFLNCGKCLSEDLDWDTRKVEMFIKEDKLVLWCDVHNEPVIMIDKTNIADVLKIADGGCQCKGGCPHIPNSE